MRYVYGDIFFVVNLALNYLLLYTTAYLTRQESTVPRLGSAALLGAIYALGFLTPVLRALYHPLVVLFFPGVMVWVAFRPRSFGQFMRLATAFYAVTLMVGGAAFAVASLRQGQYTWPGSMRPLVFPAWGYAVCLVVVLGTAAGLRALARWQRKTGAQVVGLEASFAGRTTRFKALVDTGLLLEEPLSGDPVVLADTEVAQRLLGMSDCSLADVEGKLHRLGLTHRVRFIPYEAVGKAGGVLVGLALDQLMAVDKPYQEMVLGSTVLAWAQGIAADDGSFEALVGPDIHDFLDGREQLA